MCVSSSLYRRMCIKPHVPHPDKFQNTYYLSGIVQVLQEYSLQ